MNDCFYNDIKKHKTCKIMNIKFGIAALLLAMASPNITFAQNDTGTSATTIKDLVGANITKDNIVDYISVGNGGSGSTDDGSAGRRVFLIYNEGAKKFLTPGSFWGRHAALSDDPHLFWLQRRNETLSMHYQNIRWPASTENNIDYSNDEKTNFGKYFLASSFAGVKLGSKEGGGRSYATYNSIKILKSDGSEKKDLLTSLYTAKDKNTEASLTQITKPYSPNGDVFYTPDNALADLDLSAGDELVAQITLPSTNNEKAQNILSLGTDVNAWFGPKNQGNIHIYYMLEKGLYTIQVAYCRAKNDGDSKDQQDQFYTSKKFDLGSTVTIRLNQQGISVDDQLIHSANTYKVKLTYPADADADSLRKYIYNKSGSVVKFKYENGLYILDANGYLQPTDDGTGKEYSINHNSYVYADGDIDQEHATLFISQRVIKEQGSHDNVDKYLAFAYDPNVTFEGAVGIYTDRSVVSNSTGNNSREFAQWIFIPTSTTGIYKLALKMKKNPDGTDISVAKTYYLTAMNTSVHGVNDKVENITDANANKYFYHQVDANGNWKRTVTTEAYTLADLSESDADDYSSWKIITLEEYNKLMGNNQKALENPADMTHLVSDPNFLRKSGGLSAWKADETLNSTDNTYHQAKLRIGIDGDYKTSTEQTNYEGGRGYNYSESDGNDYTSSSQNFFMSSHTQYMCATIQNGGYGRFYQDVNVYKAGWYILSCQGMSTVGAKLFIEDGDNNNSYPLTAITQNDYQDKLVCSDASKTYWPLDQNMPMYNASVWMNDRDIEEGQANLERYKTQVAIYVDNLESHQGLTQPYKALRIGIEVPQTSDTFDFTAFDSFQLYYSGDDDYKEYPRPLVLNEEFTNLDYLDDTDDFYHNENGNEVEIYKNTDLHLWRTFNPGYWNTLVLPVSLTKEQFTGAFGEDAKLVEIKYITGTKLVFQDETENKAGEYLKADKPYLIWTKKDKGDQPKAYGVLLENHNHTQTIEVSVPKFHFLIPGVTLNYNKPANGKGWNYAGLYNADGKGTYTVKNADNAYDKTEGAETEERFATFYGTLCQTYEGTSILENRPDLADGSSYYMGSGSNFYRRAKGRVMGQKGFRCWFSYTDNRGEDTGAAKYSIEFRGVSEDVDGIEDIFGEPEHKINKYSDAIYNLNGQKVGVKGDFDKLPAGIYIMNGKKMAKN